MALFGKIFGDANERVVNKLRPIVDKINSLESAFEALSDADLKGKTAEFRERLKKGATLDDLLPEAFAAVREASKRTLKQRHFDVQLIGGMVLHQGKIAEMRTGEGKTLTATLAVYVNALAGKGAHVVTVNDYLARRDVVWMGQIYYALGMSIGCINHEQAFLYDPTFQVSEEERKKLDEERDLLGSFRVVESFLRPVTRREAYAADILYGTNNEFGFDYLRDNMAQDPQEIVQRELHFAVIDEVDSILIDEARTPLIISAPDAESTKMYAQFARLVPRLQKEAHYTVDEKYRAVSLTEEGISEVEKMLGVDNIYDVSQTGTSSLRLVHHLEQALRAQALFKKDKDYVVKNGEVIIVDEFTGRLMPGRRYSEGLHQAIEAKEGVTVQRESRTLATITFQNYFRLYAKLAGMTGTAATNAEEFHKVYKLDVVVIPTNQPTVRKDLSDSVYKNEQGKFQALVREIRARHEKGQPVLVGTVSIEKNEHVSALLAREGIPHEVLNAKQHDREGGVIAQAGKRGAVTIATNVAGRGVDIILGGNPPDAAEAQEVRAAGGLHVIGTERHEARRIDNQLRGRSGRQGDPGSTQFFLSLEDEVMRIFGGERVQNMMERLGIPDDQPIEHGLISKTIEAAQSKIEGYNFDLRKHVLEFDDVMNKHREVMYRRRREILFSEEPLTEKILAMVENEIGRLVTLHTVEDGTVNIGEIEKVFPSVIPTPPDFKEKLKSLTYPEQVREYLVTVADNAYHTKEESTGVDAMRAIERMVMLRTIDMLWMDHLENMEHLRDSVRLRAYGQRDPLVEYKNEGHRLFTELLDAIEQGVVSTIFKVEVAPTSRTQAPRREPVPAMQYSHAAPPQVASSASGERIGRNDPCPCGAINPATGEVYKYKKCGLINAPYHRK